jgi:hypothetical protein
MISFALSEIIALVVEALAYGERLQRGPSNALLSNGFRRYVPHSVLR